MLLGTGCGDYRSKLVPVEGVITLDGQPLERATVSFIPQKGKGPSASGLSGSDGSFRLTTYSTGDGALPGEYKIVVTQSEVESTEVVGVGPNNPQAMIDAMKKHNDAITKKGKGATAPPKAKKSKIPDAYTKESTTPLKQQVPAGGPVKLELRSSGS
jgi:hypothetical protein